MIILGADPGQTGAVVWIEGDGVLGANIFRIVRPPIVEMSEKVIKKQVAYDVFTNHLWCSVCFDAAYIEDVHSMPRQGVSSTFKFGYGAGYLRGVIEAMAGCGKYENSQKPDPVNLVTPQAWKKALGLAGQQKEASIALAQYLFPGQEEHIEDDDVADAALIAYYGWCKQRGELK